MNCPVQKPLMHTALALLVACASARAQGDRRHRNDAAGRATIAPVVFLDSTREQDGLKGPVRRVETVVMRVEQQDGALVEKSRLILERTLYDERGRRAENETYPIVSRAAGQEFHSYDAQGNLAETVVRDARGAILSRTVYAYEFDSFGNWVKMTAALAVLNAGNVAYEPVEITNRTITYYATDAALAAKSHGDVVQPPSSDAKLVSNGAQPSGGDAGLAPNGTASTAKNKKGEGARQEAARTDERAEGNAAAHAANDNAHAEGARVAHASARELDVGVLNDRATSLPRPAFPVGGKRLDPPITVSVEVVVDQTGLVVEARAQAGAPPALRLAAEDAARRATFFPFYSEGRPVRARGRLNFGFYFSP